MKNLVYKINRFIFAMWKGQRVTSREFALLFFKVWFII